MGLIFFFVDGMGIGTFGAHNPLSQGKLTFFQELSGNGSLDINTPSSASQNFVYTPIDARLGVEGLPQSGTGQTALFTGINASKHLGKHFGPYPHSGIKPFLENESIFHKLTTGGLASIFLNAYPPIFFEHANRKNRWSCTTLMAKSAGLPLRTTSHVMDGTAVTAELFGNYWREKLGIKLPKRGPREIAEIVLNMANNYDFVLYEYYLTDKAGHDMNLQFADDILSALDSVIYEILLQNTAHTFLLCSDHGNIEDLSTKTHTLNSVPLIASGENVSAFKDCTSILDIPKAILKTFGKDSLEANI